MQTDSDKSDAPLPESAGPIVSTTTSRVPVARPQKRKKTWTPQEDRIPVHVNLLLRGCMPCEQDETYQRLSVGLSVREKEFCKAVVYSMGSRQQACLLIYPDMFPEHVALACQAWCTGRMANNLIDYLKEGYLPPQSPLTNEELAHRLLLKIREGAFKTTKEFIDASEYYQKITGVSLLKVAAKRKSAIDGLEKAASA